MSCCGGSTSCGSSKPKVVTGSSISNRKGIELSFEDEAASNVNISTSTTTTKSNSSCCSSNSNSGSSSAGGCCKSSTSAPTSASNDSCCKSSPSTKEIKINEEESNKTIISSDATEINSETNTVNTFKGCPSETPSAGSEPVCSSCPGKTACQSQSAAGNPDKRDIEIRMKVIKHKILVMSGKGGVGKSTVSSLLAYGLSCGSGKQKVSVLDVDICGPSIPKLMGVESKQIINSEYGWMPPKTPNHEIKVMSVGSLLNTPDSPVVWKGPRKEAMIRRFVKDTFWGKQDYLIIDTPPGTSDEHLSIIASLKNCNPSGAIIVTTPQDLSVSIVKKEIKLCQELHVPILGIIENLSGYVCPCCDEVTEIFKSDGGRKLAEQYNIPFLGKIPIDTNLGRCSENGKCGVCEHPTTPGVLAIQSIVENLEKILNKPQ
ncbi:hypothetical protein CYY_005460 [Polysphondylium violaceum]|uniref:Cytosolic Fe-S cluster assembly factor NUBP1 homolog n=1 Tax=Polysphondylium violaceum TaxID=133409 RepID=A0A8J4PRS7_9MYCE|nr:hypothetical protein CYY_005460 [Polysphondylium violaceum]